MPTLRVTVRDITPDQHSELVQHLRDSLIRQDQITIHDTEETPSDAEGAPRGPLLWVALVLLVATVAMLLVWIWGGEWRWGLTAVFPGAGALLSFGFSISKGAS